ncbi:putative transposase [Trichonephila clavipes]|nr:putative transposase [Trichonephila clavipes]
MYIQDRFGSYRSIEWTKTDWNCTRYSIITCFAQTSDSLARLTQTLSRMPDNHLKGHHFGTLEKIQTAVTDQLKAIPISEFHQCYEDWKKRFQRCVASEGSYFEGDNVEFNREEGGGKEAELLNAVPLCLDQQSFSPTNLGRVDEEMASPGRGLSQPMRLQLRIISGLITCRLHF